LADFEKAWTAMKAHREQVLAGAVSATPVKKRKFKVVDA
jgi:hypothetical protein